VGGDDIRLYVVATTLVGTRLRPNAKSVAAGRGVVAHIWKAMGAPPAGASPAAAERKPDAAGRPRSRTRENLGPLERTAINEEMTGTTARPEVSEQGLKRSAALAGF